MRAILSLLLLIVFFSSKPCWAEDYPVKASVLLQGRETAAELSSLSRGILAVRIAASGVRAEALDLVYDMVSRAHDSFGKLLDMLELESLHSMKVQRNSSAVISLRVQVRNSSDCFSDHMKSLYKLVGQEKDPVAIDYLVRTKELHQKVVDLLSGIDANLLGTYKELEGDGAYKEAGVKNTRR